MKLSKILLIPIATLINAIPAFLSTSCAKNDISIVNDFQTDSWSTVCYYANKGLDALKDAYKDTDSFKKNNNSFVGLERPLMINNVEHKVRVVGQNKDGYLKEGQTTGELTLAALTFQFTTAVCFSKQPQDAMFTYWGLNANNYWKSYVLHALTSCSENVFWYNASVTDWVIDKGIYGLILENDNEGWTKNMKPIRRFVNCRENDASEWKIKNESQFVFLPTISSLMSEKGIRNTKNDINYIPDKYEDAYLAESLGQYDYYALENNFGDKTMDDGDSKRGFHCLILTDLSGAIIRNQWFQTPFLSLTKCVFSTYTTGSEFGLNGSRPDESPAAIAPCFSI